MRITVLAKRTHRLWRQHTCTSANLKNLMENRGADTRVCGVETRLDAIPGLFTSWELR